MLIRTGGYDGAYAEHRVGIHLLMSVIEDAIADPSLRILDFGPGDAAYKQQFSNDNDSRQERNLLVFAPTFRAIRINAVRGVILGSARLVRRMLDAAKLTDRVRARWRDRLTRIVR
jgi:CelD/BcsL family acetyltransferase involved in cellulose biosynthesis